MLPAYYEFVFAAFAFILGAAIGSFLNVCIYRMPLGLSVNEPKRSFCPSCKYQIPWYRNLPLLSWLSLRGKCANCGAKISFRYFGVELLTGLLFLAVWWRVWMHPRAEWQGQGWVLALPYWILVSLLIVATFIDFEHYIIPDEITWGGASAGIVLSFLIPTMLGGTFASSQFVSALPGLVLWLGCILIGHHYAGPLGDLRRPALFAGLFFGGGMLAVLIATFLGSQSAWQAPLVSLIGATFGYVVLFGVVEGGKAVFGKKRFKLHGPTDFSWTRRPLPPEEGEGSDADLVVGDVSWKSKPKPSVLRHLIELGKRLFRWILRRASNEETRGESWIWSEIFSRDSDRLIIDADEARVDAETLPNASLVFTFNELHVGDRSWELEKVDVISGKANSLVIPREAMGFGDVKFIAAIGAFLGWKAVGFTIMSASTIGALVGVVSIALGRREFSAKIPFGPYLALGSLIWLFYGPEIVRWYFDAMLPPGP